MKKWLKILLFADLFSMVGMAMITPIYAIFVQQIGGDILDASSAWATFAFVSGILMYLIGKWEDRKKYHQQTLVAGYGLQAIGFLGYLYVGSVAQLLIVQSILGIATAISTPTFDALYSAFLDKGKYATEWSMWEGMNMIVTAIAALIGGVIAEYLGFRVLFVIMATIGGIGTIVSLTLLKSKKI